MLLGSAPWPLCMHVSVCVCVCVCVCVEVRGDDWEKGRERESRSTIVVHGRSFELPRKINRLSSAEDKSVILRDDIEPLCAENRRAIALLAAGSIY